MATLTLTDPLVPDDVGVKTCFCGNETVADHDFCFCSPQCARADAMRALGEDDCHYRKVMRRACTKRSSSGPAIHRHKSENQLRHVPVVNHISGLHHLRHPSKPTHEKTLPTGAEATSSGTSESGENVSDASVRDAWDRWECQNESVEPVATPLTDAIARLRGGSERRLKHSLHSRTGLNQGVRKSILALFRKAPEQTRPLKKISFGEWTIARKTRHRVRLLLCGDLAVAFGVRHHSEV